MLTEKSSQSMKHGTFSDGNRCAKSYLIPMTEEPGENQQSKQQNVQLSY